MNVALSHTLSHNIHDLAWLVTRTLPHHELRVASMLVALGAESWVPTYKRARQWSDRKIDLTTPFFPNYCLVRWPRAAWAKLLKMGGVRTVLRTMSGEAAVLNDAEMTNLRTFTTQVTAHGLQPEPTTLGAYNAGDPVRVISGPLTGVLGRVVRRRGAHRLVLAVEELGEGVMVTLPLDSMQRLDPEALRATA